MQDPLDASRKAQTTLKVMCYLVLCARMRRIATYGEIASFLGWKGAGTLAQVLVYIMYYCKPQDKPPLSVIVVNQETGLPGAGLVTAADLNSDRELVYRYAEEGNWCMGAIDARDLQEAH